MEETSPEKEREKEKEKDRPDKPLAIPVQKKGEANSKAGPGTPAGRTAIATSAAALLRVGSVQSCAVPRASLDQRAFNLKNVLAVYVFLLSLHDID